LPHYRVTLAYDGTDFAGFQLQRRAGGRTVQGAVEEALSRLSGGSRVAVAGSGRTGRRDRLATCDWSPLGGAARPE